MERIRFANEPEALVQDVYKETNEAKIVATERFKEFLASDPEFAGKDMEVYYPHSGVSSLVAIVRMAEHQPLVIKIPLMSNNPTAEPEAFRVWERAGARVPRILRDGRMGGEMYFMVLEYVPAPTLSAGYKRDYEKMLTDGVFEKMGFALSIMHKAKAVGYGRFKDGQGKCQTFADFVQGSDYLQRAFDYVREVAKPLDMERRIDEAVLVATEYSAKQNSSCYCHNDFGPYNVFMTEPLTVFDPNPVLSEGLCDLGLMLGIMAGRSDNENIREQMIAGYFAEESRPDPKVLKSFEIIGFAPRLRHWSIAKDNELVTRGMIRMNRLLAEEI